MIKTDKLKWEHNYGNEQLLEIWVNEGSVWFADGPSYPTARNHEAQVWSRTFAQFANDTNSLTDWPGVYSEICVELKAEGLI